MQILRKTKNDMQISTTPTNQDTLCATKMGWTLHHYENP